MSAVHTQTLKGRAENMPETERYSKTLSGISKRERKTSCYSSEIGMTFFFKFGQIH